MIAVVAGIIVMAIILLLALFIYAHYFSAPHPGINSVSENLYRPPPPKGISIVAGNVVWHYDNMTRSVVITSFSQNNIIMVTAGQELGISPYHSAGILYLSSNSVSLLNTSVKNTGKATIVNIAAPPT